MHQVAPLIPAIHETGNGMIGAIPALNMEYTPAFHALVTLAVEVSKVVGEDRANMLALSVFSMEPDAFYRSGVRDVEAADS